MWIEIRDPRTKRLLFKYDPVNEQIEIVHRDGMATVDLLLVKSRNAKRITGNHLMRGLTPDPETA